MGNAMGKIIVPAIDGVCAISEATVNAADIKKVHVGALRAFLKVLRYELEPDADDDAVVTKWRELVTSPEAGLDAACSLIEWCVGQRPLLPMPCCDDLPCI